MRQKIYTGMAVLAAVMLISGASVVALASPATTSDPLISLSYLNGPFRTAMNTHVASQAATLTAEFNARAAQVEAQVTGSIAANQRATFVLRTLNNGQALSIADGAEVMLRGGSANITAGAFINYTTGGDQSSGALAHNNMYIAAGAGTITATANATTILVRG